MNSNVNLGFFLTKLFKYNLSSKNRMSFFNKVFEPIIDDFGLKTKDGSKYEFGKERVSKIFNNKLDLPTRFKKIFKDLSDDKITLYKNNLYLRIKNLIAEINFLPFSNEIFLEVKKSRDFDSNLICKFKNSLDNNDYESFFWDIFSSLCLHPNVESKSPSLFQGRPKDYYGNESFFYLSNDEKEIKAKQIINLVLNKKVKLTISDLRYFFEVLEYWDVILTDEEKIIICCNLLKIWDNSKPCAAEELNFEFFCAKDTYIENPTPFFAWEDSIEKANSINECNKLKKLLDNSQKKQNYKLIEEEIIYLSRTPYFINSNEFLNSFSKNNFFLPNFFGHINRSLWVCCHTIAYFIGSTSKAEEFCKYLTDVIKNNITNRTIKDRCEGLIDRCNKTKKLFTKSSH